MIANLYCAGLTQRASAYRLLEEALNLRDIRIYDTVEDANGKETRVLNVKETTLAAQKQDAKRTRVRFALCLAKQIFPT